MSKHLFGLILTGFGVAANNRGETGGNMTTLQKLLWKGDVHTTVSAEAIRAAIRYYWQHAGAPLNRCWDDEKRTHSWKDPEFEKVGVPFVDDDVLGFMSARAGREEADPGDSSSGGRRTRPRGTIDARRARLEVTRAISLHPWPGDVTFSAASPGATAAASRTGRDPVPYSTEVHATRYQYGFALTPDDLHERSRAKLVVDALLGLSEVAGNHARFLYDFSPSSLILRWTDDPAPRMLYAFETDESDREIGVPSLVRLVQSGDVHAQELYVGGEITAAPDGHALNDAGAHVAASVAATAAAVQEILTA